MTSLPTKDENAGSDGPAYLRPAARLRADAACVDALFR